MNKARAWVAVGVALSFAAIGCGDTGQQPGTNPVANDGEKIEAVSDELRWWCSSTRHLVCGRDGRTYSNVCRAGGSGRVAHDGACAGYACNGVVCATGFTCRTTSNFGVTTDQCVSNTGAPPPCNCGEGLRCVQEASGATNCVANSPPPPPPEPATLCDGKQCPAGQHCQVITINYGVPTASCMYD